MRHLSGFLLLLLCRPMEGGGQEVAQELAGPEASDFLNFVLKKLQSLLCLAPRGTLRVSRCFWLAGLRRAAGRRWRWSWRAPRRPTS